MKRGRTKNIVLQDGEQPGFEGCQETREVLPSRISPRTAAPLTPPSSPEHQARPSKLRRHSSKIMTVLRSMTNNCTLMSFKMLWLMLIPKCVASHASIAEVDIPNLQPSNSPGLGKKISMAMLKGQPDPTVVHRAQFRANRPVVISIDKEEFDPAVIEIVPGSSPSTSAGDSTSTGRKSSAPGLGQSTGKTSLDSKWSSKHNVVSNSAHSSENKKSGAKQAMAEAGIDENILCSIAEAESHAAEIPVPSKCPRPSYGQVFVLTRY
jgi:protein-serine/threonine kinase